MKTLRMVLAAGMLAVTLMATTPATAHRLDLMTPNKAGPIQRGETTMRQMRRWFGAPTARKVVRVGCVRVIKARWGSKLMVYASRDPRRTRPSQFGLSAPPVKKSSFARKLSVGSLSAPNVGPISASPWSSGC